MFQPMVIVRASRIPLAVLCGILVMACGDIGTIGDGLTDRPTPPTTAREPLTPGSAGLAWAVPSAGDGSWVIGPQGVGVLMVGTAYSPDGQPEAGLRENDFCTVVTPPGAPAGLVAWVNRGNIVALVASEPGPRLLGGVEVGTSEAEVRRRFAGSLTEGVGADSLWLTEARPETLSGYPVAFEIVDGHVNRIRVGDPSPGGECR